MEQDRGGSRHEGRLGLRLRRAVRHIVEGALDLREAGQRLIVLAEVQEGVGAYQAGGEARPRIVRGEVGPRLPDGLLRLAGEVKVFGPGDVALGPLLHGLDRLQALSGGEGRVHQRHESPLLEERGEATLLRRHGPLGMLLRLAVHASSRPSAHVVFPSWGVGLDSSRPARVPVAWRTSLGEREKKGAGV